MRLIIFPLISLLLVGCGGNNSKQPQESVTGKVLPSIPSNYNGFVQYLEGKEDLGVFEGIWEDVGDNDSAEYTLGIYSDKTDIRYPYKAFILESNMSRWKPGQIKIKFSRFDLDGLAVSTYYMGDKSPKKVTWEVTGNDLITSITGLNNSGFLKIYPRSVDKPKKQVKGSGSGWHLGSGYIVTNAHVISGAKSIKVRTTEGLKDAQVVSLNQKLDLAVLFIADTPTTLGVAPLSTNFSAGQRVFAIGYPLGSLLGNKPKITDGLISSLEGIQSDPTNLTISVPIQPGSSGGPLLDEMGNVVGVVVAKLRDEASPDGDTENVNYAVNVKYLLPLIEGLDLPTAESMDTPASNICDLRCSSVVYIETES